jgi:hypothetical protein
MSLLSKILIWKKKSAIEKTNNKENSIKFKKRGEEGCGLVSCIYIVTKITKIKIDNDDCIFSIVLLLFFVSSNPNLNPQSPIL